MGESFMLQKTHTFFFDFFANCKELKENAKRLYANAQPRSSVALMILFLLISAFVAVHLLSSAQSFSNSHSTDSSSNSNKDRTLPKLPKITLNCSVLNFTGNCPVNAIPKHSKDAKCTSAPKCPEYFRWIYEDLRPWATTGINRKILEGARRTANFRLTIINGRAYVETYLKSFQTRDVFTLWGILQLLHMYPGEVPDLELMFDCVDWPIISAFQYNKYSALSPPPLFRYCGDDDTLDIVFPDWSFWGWPEISIKPWERLLKELTEGNKKTKWINREPYAYWKGNPTVGKARPDLMKCNVSENQDWGARLYSQNWLEEARQGFNHSDLSTQCNHKYKIYVEGSAWSVSEKYILACDSVTLLVKPHFYDFFTRGLIPLQHYWPINDSDMCRSIKFAVDWGNRHKQRAQEIGKSGTNYILEELSMKHVYDYMLHLLKEYSKLLTFKPAIARNAVEVCPETLACSADGLGKVFMLDSMVTSPSETCPCALPPPFGPSELHSVIKKRQQSVKGVASLERTYWNNHNSSS